MNDGYPRAELSGFAGSKSSLSRSISEWISYYFFIFFQIRNFDKKNYNNAPNLIYKFLYKFFFFFKYLFNCLKHFGKSIPFIFVLSGPWYQIHAFKNIDDVIYSPSLNTLRLFFKNKIFLKFENNKEISIHYSPTPHTLISFYLMVWKINSMKILFFRLF